MGKCDRWVLSLTVLLVIFGALMIYSTTSVVTPVLARKGVSEFFYFKRHLFTILMGFSFMCIAYFLKPAFIKKMAIPLLIISFLLLLLVFIPNIGVTASGARRWIRLWPSTFQPSELVKLSMVIFLAKYISLPDYRQNSLLSFMIPVGVMIVFQIAILMQPDFGAAMSLAFLTFSMIYLSGVRFKYIASLSILAITAVIILIMEPYRLRRITSFLNPWEDPLDSGFQLVQSFIALGSGGLGGLGLGSSRQKLAYLPEPHTDFIFSIIGEEFGFIGVSLVIVAFVLLFVRGIFIANRTKNGFLYYLASGISLMVSLQALINFAVATGMVPTKGLPLPFVSYGGSSLLVNMMAMGILLRISRGDEDEKIAETDRNIIVRKKARRTLYGASYPGKTAEGELSDGFTRPRSL
ncbi:MAG: putative lipid II flippase FtsW [Nitrospirota bacterium]